MKTSIGRYNWIENTPVHYYLIVGNFNTKIKKYILQYTLDS